jgi:Flp pilus assembly protein TadG
LPHNELPSEVPASCMRRPNRLSRRFWRNNRGVAAIEFALVGMPFFFIVFAIIEVGLVTGANIMLDNAVHDAARRVMTGEVQAADLDEAGFRKMVCDGVSTLMTCSKVKIDLRTFATADKIPTSVTMKLGTVDDSTFCYDPGSQETITVLRAFYEWPYFVSMLSSLASDSKGNAVLMSMAAFMNEPFGARPTTKSTCS